MLKHNDQEVFSLLNSDNNSQATIEFDALFKNEYIRWQAEIKTLIRWQTDLAKTRNHRQITRQFIEIPANQTGQLRQIRVGLQVDRIDQAVLLKTVIMLRQYKKLDTGWHSFGDNI